MGRRKESNDAQITGGTDYLSNEEKRTNSVEQEESVEYELSGIRLLFVMVGMCLAVFLMALDTSIIATAIPRITSHFHSTDDIGWYGSAYALTLCSLQPLAGKLYTIFSLKHVLLSFFTILEFGSLLCGASTNSKMLIVGRAIAGIGGAGIATGVMSIVASVLPMQRRPIFLGIIQSTFSAATVVGPLLGGLLTQHVSWRWCFYINLPLGTITFFTILFLFHPPPKPTDSWSFSERLVKLDLLGAALFTPAMMMLLMAVQWGGNKYAWKSATILGLFCGFGGLIVVFAIWQLHQGDRAMIPRRILVQRTVFAACISAFFTMGALATVVYYIPEWFQVIKAASPSKSGLMYLSLSLSDIFAGNLSGFLISRLGCFNPFLLLGTVLMSVGIGLLSTFNISTSHTFWIPYQVIYGLGVGMAVSIPVIAVQTVLKNEDVPVGAAIVMLFQFAGGSAFLAISQSIFLNEVITSLKAHGIDAIEIQAIIKAGSSNVRNIIGLTDLPSVLESYNTGITSTFYLATAGSSVSFLAGLFLEWRNIKGKSSKATM